MVSVGWSVLHCLFSLLSRLCQILTQDQILGNISGAFCRNYLFTLFFMVQHSRPQVEDRQRGPAHEGRGLSIQDDFPQGEDIFAE
jgi:hypothetical protein